MTDTDGSQDGLAPGSLARFGVRPEVEALWRALMINPLAEPHQLARQVGTSCQFLAVALEELASVHLVRPSGTPTGYVAIDPAMSIAAHIVRAERDLAAELDDLAQLRRHIPSLSSDYARGRAAAGDLPGFEIVLSLDDIERQGFVASELTKEIVRNIMLKQSPAGRRMARPMDTALLARGITLRTIVGAQDIADPDFYAELEIAHGLGEEFRTIERVPTRMIICDRDVAILPLDPENIDNGAMFVRVGSLVDVLIYMFDRMWEGATPLFGGKASASDGLTGRKARVLELLAAGYTDLRVARTLGVSERTVRREVSELRDALGVSSRTEIVPAALRRQWL